MDVIDQQINKYEKFQVIKYKYTYFNLIFQNLN